MGCVFNLTQTDDMRLKVLKAKIEMTKNMVETIKSSPLISKKTSTAEDFANFVANVRFISFIKLMINSKSELRLKQIKIPKPGTETFWLDSAMNLKLTWTVTLGIQTQRWNIVFMISKVAVHQFKNYSQ